MRQRVLCAQLKGWAKCLCCMPCAVVSVSSWQLDLCALQVGMYSAKMMSCVMPGV